MCSWPRADFGSGPTRSMPIRSKGTSMMGNGINGLGEECWVRSAGTLGRRGRSASPPHPSRASGSGRGSSGWYWGLLGGRPSDGSARAPSPSQSWAEARPAAVFPPPSAGRHSRAGHSGRWSGGPGVEGAGRPSPRSLSLESSSVLADRPRAVPWRKSRLLNLLKHIKEKVSGLGGGLTVSRAVRGQQDGALSGTSAELPGSAAPGGAGGLGREGEQAVKAWPVSPQKYRDGEVLH